ncbi:hypothetical protein ACF063_35585 [Streptomyces chartreusis]|uniref:hypothetical protein n=1 Tax=Streptomyces chartreusis TaxID=1969 RepID=UPI0036FBF8FB
MEAVAARAVRAAAETISEVRSGPCLVLPDDDAVGVSLDIHAPAGPSLPDNAVLVLERVRQAADRELGMTVAVVDIRITDVVPDPDPDPRNKRAVLHDRTTTRPPAQATLVEGVTAEAEG